MDLVVGAPEDEAFLLDLLNTTPVIDGTVHDELADPVAARAWLRQRGITPPKDELAALVAARTALQKLVHGEVGPEVLTPFLDAIRLRPVAGDDGVDWRIDAAAGFAGAARAALAWDALRISSPGRLRPCANPECRLFLIDRSKPNTARWCSMAVCGNRMKARRHYRRVHVPDE